MGLPEILIVFAVIVAIMGGIGVHRLLSLSVLRLAAALSLTRHGPGARRVEVSSQGAPGA
jgi:hypothetical protein